MTRDEFIKRRKFMAEHGVTKCAAGTAYGAINSKLTVRPKSFNHSKSEQHAKRLSSISRFDAPATVPRKSLKVFDK